MSKLKVKILGTGVHLPSRLVHSEELEKTMGFPMGTHLKMSGVKTRYFVSKETSSEMGTLAAERALLKAGINKLDLDAIISVSGVPQQAIPSTAALIHRKLGLQKTVAFDINATCVSFLTGLFLMSHLISQRVYKHVLLVAADIASGGLNPSDPKTSLLFGDGAAAVVLGPSGSEGIIASAFETRSDGGDQCQCESGGTLFGLRQDIPRERYYFHMNGPRLFKLALPPLLKMVRQLVEKSGGLIDLFIPHQASPYALEILQKKLRIADGKFMNIVSEYGNMIATSLPFALHQAIESGRLQRGQKAMLFGTAAGLTIGGVVLEY